MITDQRIQNEIVHGRYLKAHGATEIWNWETPAGRERWKRRVDMLTSHIRKNMDVLEIGCGTGYLTKELAKKDANITAIDISQDLLEIAQKTVSIPNVIFKMENAYKLSFSDNSFDTIVGSSVLHHLEIEQALREFIRVLKRGGTIYFTEPNMLNPQIAIQKNIPAVKRRMGESPDETAFFRWSLKRKLKKLGFINIHITPFDFLHPKIPKRLIPVFKSIGDIIEQTPLISEIAGSIYIRANKPTQ